LELQLSWFDFDYVSNVCGLKYHLQIMIDFYIILNFVGLVHHGSSHCILSGIYNVWFQTLIREVCIAFKISLLGTVRAWIKTMLYLLSHCVLIFLQKAMKVVDNLAAQNFGLEGWDFLFFIFWRMTSLLWNLMPS
jgi:hypothetical protein